MRSELHDHVIACVLVWSACAGLGTKGLQSERRPVRGKAGRAALQAPGDGSMWSVRSRTNICSLRAHASHGAWERILYEAWRLRGRVHVGARAVVCPPAREETDIRLCCDST